MPLRRRPSPSPQPLICTLLPLRWGPANQRAPLTCWRRGGGGAASPRLGSALPHRSAPRRQRYRHRHRRHGVRGLRLLQELPLRPQPALHGAARGGAGGFGGRGLAARAAPRGWGRAPRCVSGGCRCPLVGLRCPPPEKGAGARQEGGGVR